MITQNVGSRKGRAHSRRAGFSVIEILVVLVILLVGILTILRLFPGGFLTIKRTGELTSAEALANQSLSRMKEAGGMIESVIATDANGVPDLTARPDDMTDVLDGDGNPDWYRSNANQSLRVIGETIRIPVPTANAATGGFGATALLHFGPVRNRFFVTNGNPDDLIDVRGASMERIQANSGATLEQVESIPVLREGQYAIDYRRRRIAFFPRRATGRTINFRLFSIRYEYQALVNNQIIVRSALAGEIRVPDQNLQPLEDLKPVWQPILNDPNDTAVIEGRFSNATHPLSGLGATPPTGGVYYGTLASPTTGILPESEDISRAFRLLTVTPAFDAPPPAWSDDPYEYVWYSPQMFAESGSNRDVSANLGVLLFNPRGYSATIDTPTGPQPFTARVNYLIFDNHIIRDERQVPTSAPYTVRLALNNILQNGEVLNDNSTYTGMFRGFQPTTVVGRTPDIMIVNANTGQTLAEIAANSCTQYNNEDAFALDAKNGTIRFARNFIESGNLQNATIKVLYRAQGDWGMQIQKAHNRYVQADVPSTIDPGNGGRPMDYRSYYVGGSTNNTGSPTRVYFPITETGKTIVLGNVYGVDGNGNFLHYSNDAYKTQQVRGASLGNIPLCYIDVSEKHPTFTVFNARRTGKAVDNVHGGSVTARIVWRNGTRWRKLDSETFLSK